MRVYIYYKYNTGFREKLHEINVHQDRKMRVFFFLNNNKKLIYIYIYISMSLWAFTGFVQRLIGYHINHERCEVKVKWLKLQINVNGLILKSIYLW